MENASKSLEAFVEVLSSQIEKIEITDIKELDGLILLLNKFAELEDPLLPIFSITLVEIAENIIELRSKSDTFKEFPIPEYDLFIPFKAGKISSHKPPILGNYSNKKTSRTIQDMTKKINERKKSEKK
ncbi:MAG: hypothetical protein ACFFDN_03805 [Candidatus Hodarchaeota archaeon]